MYIYVYKLYIHKENYKFQHNDQQAELLTELRYVVVIKKQNQTTVKVHSHLQKAQVDFPNPNFCLGILLLLFLFVFCFCQTRQYSSEILPLRWEVELHLYSTVSHLHRLPPHPPPPLGWPANQIAELAHTHTRPACCQVCSTRGTDELHGISEGCLGAGSSDSLK